MKIILKYGIKIFKKMSIVVLFLLGLLWSWFITSFATSLGYHRYFSHKQFEAPIWFEYFVLLLAPLGGTPSVISWAAVHRIHHAYADTDKDPHSPSHLSIIDIFLGRFNVDNVPVKFVIDLLKNPRVVWFHKYGKYIHWLISLLVIILLPIQYFLFFIVLPFLYGYASYGLLNVLCHTKQGIRNLILITVLTGGEGWHHVHHDDSKLYRLHKYDLLGWVTEKLFKPI